MTTRELRFIMTALRKMPKFKNEEEERVFWSDHDAADYVDFSVAGDALFPNRPVPLDVPLSPAALSKPHPNKNQRQKKFIETFSPLSQSN
jgi:hypothetical protein